MTQPPSVLDDNGAVDIPYLQGLATEEGVPPGRCPKCKGQGGWTYPDGPDKVPGYLCDACGELDCGQILTALRARKNGSPAGELPEPEGFRPGEPVKGVRAASTIEPQNVSWLWPGWIPQGMLAVIDGDPGLGKSFLTIDLAARITRGRPMPGPMAPAVERGNVVIASAEDSPSHTIRPRLEAAGADLDRAYILVDQDDEWPTLDNVGHWGSTILSTEARLLIVDPLMAFLPPDRNSHKDQDIRRLLGPLAAMAQERNCTVLFIRHLNKQSGGNPLYRGGGSIGIVGAARSGMLVAPDPEMEGWSALVSTKSNLAPAPEALRWRISGDGETPAVEWGGTTTTTARELLAEGGEPGQRDEAEAFLREELAGGPQPSRDIETGAAAMGISKRTLERARKALGVEAVKEGKVWHLRLAKEDRHG